MTERYIYSMIGFGSANDFVLYKIFGHAKHKEVPFNYKKGYLSMLPSLKLEIDTDDEIFIHQYMQSKKQQYIDSIDINNTSISTKEKYAIMRNKLDSQGLITAIIKNGNHFQFIVNGEIKHYYKSRKTINKKLKKLYVDNINKSF